MKSKKTIVMAVLIIVALALQLCASAASVYSRQKKSIFLVMDDSGSMGIDGTSDASYSVQTLIAMTDKNDSVKISFMNNTNALGKIDMSNKSNTLITDIKNKYPVDNGGTPYQPVKVAKQEIQSAAAAGDETEYWLVVFTDGSFAEVADGTLDVNNDLRTFAQTTLANGTKPNVLFITNGTVSPISSAGIPNLYGVSNGSIIDSMNEAARIISGRAVITNPSYSQGNSVLDFDLPYPAKNIIVFTQNNKVNITSSSAASTLNTSENYVVTHTGGMSGVPKESTVCFITEAQGSSISQGHVTLKFDKAVYPKDTTILYEPAIGIIATYYNQDGQVIDPQNLAIGQSAKVTYTLCDSGTNQPLPESLFGGAIKYSTEINGTPYNSNEVDFKVDSDKINIKMNVTLPDGYVMSIQNEYEDLTEARTVNLSLSNNGHFNSDYDKLKDAEGIVATVLINGDPLTADQLNDFTLQIRGHNVINSNFSIEKDEANGTFVIRPQKGLVGVFTPKDKTYDVVLTDKNGDQYTAALRVEIPGPRPWIDLVVFILGILLVIYFIIVFATKKYFPKGKLLELYWNGRPVPNTDEIPDAFSFGTLIWYEFKMIFRGNFTFFKHLAKQLLPNQCLCVTLFGVGDDAFSDITIHARNSQSLYVEDTTLREGKYGGYDSDYLMYDTNAKTKLQLKHMIRVEGDVKGYTFSLNQVLSKPSKNGKYEFVYYLKFASRN